ncbi:MAG: hypothetical protein M5R38_18405 [Candidatus Methylomirabilis sp.]|nr:hypothetical protein [Candidatus Methylomirabilis sp.]
MKAAVKASAIEHLSGPRIFRELHLIAHEPSAPRIIWRLRNLGVLTAIHPTLVLPAAAFGLCERVQAMLSQEPSMPFVKKVDASEAFLLVILSFLHPKTVVTVLHRLAPPHRIADKLRGDHKGYRITARTLMRAVDLRQSRIARLLDPLSPEAKIVLLAAVPNGPAQEAVSRYLTTSWQIVPLLKGHDLHRLGLKPGPIYRQILAGLRAAKLDGRLHTREDEVAFVLQRFGEMHLRA